MHKNHLVFKLSTVLRKLSAYFNPVLNVMCRAILTILCMQQQNHSCTKSSTYIMLDPLMVDIELSYDKQIHHYCMNRIPAFKSLS